MCQAYGCSNKPSKSSLKSFFAIPHPQKEPARCRAWIYALGTGKYTFESYKYCKSRVVCEDHFEASCFERDLPGELGVCCRKKKLKPDTLPTIFLHKKETPSQKSGAAMSSAHESSKVGFGRNITHTSRPTAHRYRLRFRLGLRLSQVQ